MTYDEAAKAIYAVLVPHLGDNLADIVTGSVLNTIGYRQMAGCEQMAAVLHERDTMWKERNAARVLATRLFEVLRRAPVFSDSEGDALRRQAEHAYKARDWE